MFKLTFRFVALIAALLFGGSAFGACCNSGCCDCGCVTKKLTEIKEKSDQITADLNKVLREHKVAGYISEYRITTTDDLDGNGSPLFLPKGCSYPCDEKSGTLLCKAQCK